MEHYYCILVHFTHEDSRQPMLNLTFSSKPMIIVDRTSLLLEDFHALEGNDYHLRVLIVDESSGELVFPPFTRSLSLSELAHAISFFAKLDEIL